jgi:hypothetical protein
LRAAASNACAPVSARASRPSLDDYAGLTWSDLAAERGDRIAAAMREFLSRRYSPPGSSASPKSP